LYRYGVVSADLVIAQTARQVFGLKSAFGVSAHILPMPCPPNVAPGNYMANQQGSPTDEQVILVGRISREKHVELFLEIAEKLPNINFLIVGPVDEEDEYCATILERAKRLANLQFYGAATRGQLTEIYSRTSILCCTSHYEGFPNTFLEAWSHGIPIVSTADPDGILERHKLGFYARSSGDFVRKIRKLIESPVLSTEYGNAGRDYFQKHHELNNAMRRFESAFSGVLST